MKGLIDPLNNKTAYLNSDMEIEQSDDDVLYYGSLYDYISLGNRSENLLF